MIGRSSGTVKKGGKMFLDRCEVPDFASEMKKLQGIQPRLQLSNSPWGHGAQCVDDCDCLMSDRVDAYVHCLIQGDPCRSNGSG